MVHSPCMYGRYNRAPNPTCLNHRPFLLKLQGTLQRRRDVADFANPPAPPLRENLHNTMSVPIWGLAKGRSIFKTNTRVMTRLMPTIKEVKCIMNPLDGGHSTAAK